MFIADKVEPNKARKWKPLLRVHRLALETGLEAAALKYLDLRLKQAVREAYLIQPQAIHTRNYLLTRV
jgi:HD superfamily phosphohydrolase YqeK